MGDLETAHGRPAPFRAAHGGGIVFAFEAGEISAGRMDFPCPKRGTWGWGWCASRVLRLDLIIDERVEQEHFSHILEEVLLSPALEHAVGDLDIA